MTHRIKSVKPIDNCVVIATFLDGTVKEYDMKTLYSGFPQFQVFETDKELFNKVQVDVGGYGISWNDDLDLDANDIWEDGKELDKVPQNNVVFVLSEQLSKARDKANMTQKQLSEATGIYQGDISKIERGLANPSLLTLQRIAEGMGMELKIEFI